MRYVAGLVLLAGFGCTRPAAEKLAVDPTLARLVPADTVLLAGVRVQELRATPLFRKLESRGGVRQMADSLAKSGFDVSRDVSVLVAASNGSATVVLAKGRFKIAGMEALNKSEYRGRTIYGNGDSSFTVLDETTAAAGSVAAVRAAIDRAAAGSGSGNALLTAAEGLPITSQIWAVGADLGALADRYVPRDGNIANARRLLKSTKSVTLSADLRAGVKATITAACGNDQDAKLLNDTLRGILGLGRLSVPEDRRELLRVYDGVKVERQELTIRVEIDEPDELLDRLIEMFTTPSTAVRRP
ncbi:MAG: hypothetical protein EXQ52_03760 [Bryobacterales bacterium]|nr:hypothetical protein [Bryobacterales bacterium]